MPVNPELQVKRLSLDVEELLEYQQSEELLTVIAEVVAWLKEDVRTIDGRERRLTLLHEMMESTREPEEEKEEEN